MAFIRPTSTYFSGGAPGGPFPLHRPRQQKKRKQTAVGATFSYAKTTAHYSKIWPRTNAKVRNKHMLLRNRGKEQKERIYSGEVCSLQMHMMHPGIITGCKITARCGLTRSLRWEVEASFVLPSRESVFVRSREVQLKIIQHPSQSTSKQPEQFLQTEQFTDNDLEWKLQQRYRKPCVSLYKNNIITFVTFYQKPKPLKTCFVTVNTFINTNHF